MSDEGKSEFEKKTGFKNGLGGGAIRQEDGTYISFVSLFDNGEPVVTLKECGGFSSESAAIAHAVSHMEEFTAQLVEMGLVTEGNLHLIDREQKTEVVH